MNEPAPDRTEHRVERRYELPATPDEVWQAIATADGIASWMAPTRLDPRVGGAISFDLGFWSHGIITDYSPPHRFTYVEPWPMAEHMATTQHDITTLSPIATEFLIESASGGSCVLRVVTSAYGAGADWEREFFDEMADGWVVLLDRLAERFTTARQP